MLFQGSPNRITHTRSANAISSTSCSIRTANFSSVVAGRLVRSGSEVGSTLEPLATDLKNQDLTKCVLSRGSLVMKNLLYHCKESYVSGKILCMCLRGFVRPKRTNGEPE